MKKLFVAIIAIWGIATVAVPAQAQINVFQQCQPGAAGTSQTANTAVCKATNTGALFGPGSIWNNVLNIFTVVIGAISVLMIIVGGLRYITSNGDATQTTGAKNTIMYAVIGLVFALMANAIVNFVLANI